MNQLRQLLRPDLAGDPMGRQGLWSGLHLEEISGHLKALGLSVCPHTVRRLLAELHVALHANRKSLSGPQSPHRDAQFQYLHYQREQFAQAGLPIVSVDTKKKEQVGRFKKAGRTWGQQPVLVNDHDFPSLGSGVAIPRGLYDVQANRGWVVGEKEKGGRPTHFDFPRTTYSSLAVLDFNHSLPACPFLQPHAGVPWSAKSQPRRNAFDRQRSFNPQAHGQRNFYRVALAPGSELRVAGA